MVTSEPHIICSFSSYFFAERPTAKTSLRLIQFSALPKFIWMIRQRPNLFSHPIADWISTLCPRVAGPLKVPRSLPPENSFLPERGSSFESRIWTFLVLCQQQYRILLKRTTFATDTFAPFPKSSASQGALSRFEWHKSVVDESQKGQFEKRKRNLKAISPISRGEREI